MGKCDKCGKDVPPENDASLLAAYSGELSKAELISVSSRHLLPTNTCEGSPSRAQYLYGQKRDTRGYKYQEDKEQGIRMAFRELWEDVNAGKYDSKDLFLLGTRATHLVRGWFEKHDTMTWKEFEWLLVESRRDATNSNFI